ncbi:hypothetical protein [Oleidesulfovibrio alaskensis]
MTQADNDVLLAVEGLRIRFDGPAAEAEKRAEPDRTWCGGSAFACAAAGCWA